MNYNELAKEIYLENKAKGFWDEPRSEQHCVMLIITELSEAVEAFRKNGLGNTSYLDIAWQLKNFDAQLFKSTIKDTIFDELADACIRILDTVGGFNLNIDIPTSDLWTVNSSYLSKDKNFIENIYWITLELMSMEESGIESSLARSFFCINKLCEIYGIDLNAFIKLKRMYNKTRPRLHGKIC